MHSTSPSHLVCCFKCVSLKRINENLRQLQLDNTTSEQLLFTYFLPHFTFLFTSIPILFASIFSTTRSISIQIYSHFAIDILEFPQSLVLIEFVVLSLSAGSSLSHEHIPFPPWFKNPLKVKKGNDTLLLHPKDPILLRIRPKTWADQQFRMPDQLILRRQQQRAPPQEQCQHMAIRRFRPIRAMEESVYRFPFRRRRRLPTKERRQIIFLYVSMVIARNRNKVEYQTDNKREGCRRAIQKP